MRSSQYNINAIKKNQTVLEAYPELNNIPSWSNYRKREGDKLFRYAILMYSIDTPLYRDYPQLSQRRDRAAYMAGYPKTNSGDYAKYIKDIQSWQDAEVRTVFLDFIKHQNEPKWAQLITLENMFWENLEHMNSPLTSGDTKKDTAESRLKALELKAKLTDQNDKILESIDNLERQLFKDDEDAVKAFRDQAVNSPEKFAQRHKNGQEVDV